MQNQKMLVKMRTLDQVSSDEVLLRISQQPVGHLLWLSGNPEQYNEVNHSGHICS